MGHASRCVCMEEEAACSLRKPRALSYTIAAAVKDAISVHKGTFSESLLIFYFNT